ncbi:MAG: tripartite tricarboxylate transporter TctB family protein [Proteobacteria bacterium]|nr:tripartite tricarboxylate transporter TctB family protein [Pseudomonadota bacterium]MDA1021902.1 tripartite tricarboxylate transporter TctB family protein [Pseudomonadota bacterium]
MQRMSHDTVVAMVLLVFCGVFIWASFDIRQPDYGVLMPSTWPRVVLGALTLLSMIYLIQSLRGDETVADAVKAERDSGLKGWLRHWRNPIWCFVLFFAYLVTLPVLGTLIGGISFVFVLQGVLGGWAPRSLVLHASVAVIAVGGMWSLFTFGLGVLLPPGMILGQF